MPSSAASSRSGSSSGTDSSVRRARLDWARRKSSSRAINAVPPPASSKVYEPPNRPSNSPLSVSSSAETCSTGSATGSAATSLAVSATGSETVLPVSSVGVSMAEAAASWGRIRQRFPMRQYLQRVQVRVGVLSPKPEFRHCGFGFGSNGRFFRFCFGRGNFCFRFFNRFFDRFLYRFLYRCLFGRFRRHGCSFGFGFRRLRFGLFRFDFFGCCRFDPVQIRNVKHAARTQSAVCGNIWVCLQQRIGNLFERQVFRTDGGGNLFERFAFADGMGFAVMRRFDG